jgi:hypothetical protein
MQTKSRRIIRLVREPGAAGGDEFDWRASSPYFDPNGHLETITLNPFYMRKW